MSRITRAQVDRLADVVSTMLGLPSEVGQAFTGALCASCKRRDVDRESSFDKGCIVCVQGLYGGYAVRMRHADSGESDLGNGIETLRNTHTFLRGMRAALLEIRD